MVGEKRSRGWQLKCVLSLIVLLLTAATDARPIALPGGQASTSPPAGLQLTVGEISQLPRFPSAGITFTSRAVAAPGSVALQVPPPGLSGQPLQQSSLQYSMTVGWDVLQVTIVTADQPLFLNQQRLAPGHTSPPILLVGQVTILSVIATTMQDVALRTYVIYVYRPSAPPGQELPTVLPSPPAPVVPTGGLSSSPPVVILPGAAPAPGASSPPPTRRPRAPRTSAPLAPPTTGSAIPTLSPQSTPSLQPTPTTGTPGGAGQSPSTSTPVPSSTSSAGAFPGATPAPGATASSPGASSGPTGVGTTPSSSPANGGGPPSSSAPPSSNPPLTGGGATAAPGSGSSSPGSQSSGGTKGSPSETGLPTGTAFASPPPNSGTVSSGQGSGGATSPPGPTDSTTGSGASSGGSGTGTPAATGGSSTPSTPTPNASSSPGSGSGSRAPSNSGSGSGLGGNSAPTGPPGSGAPTGNPTMAPGGQAPTPVATPSEPAQVPAATGSNAGSNTGSPAGQGGGSGSTNGSSGSTNQPVPSSSSPPGGGSQGSTSPPAPTSSSPPSGGAGSNGSGSSGSTGGPNASPPNGNGGGTSSPSNGGTDGAGSSNGGATNSPLGTNAGGTNAPPGSQVGGGGTSPPGVTLSPGENSGGSSPPNLPSPSDVPSSNNPTPTPTPASSASNAPEPNGSPTTGTSGTDGTNGTNGGNADSPPGDSPPTDSPTQSPSDGPSDPSVCTGNCNPGAGWLTVAGVAFDSYLQSCAVFLDLNGDQQQASDEPSGMTDLFGQFNMSTPAYAPLVLLAGGQCTDAATGVLLPGNLRAPAEATVITPLTTLLLHVAQQSLGDGTALDLAAAERMVAAGLGLDLSPTLTLTGTDVIATVLAEQDTAAAWAVVQNTRLQNAVAMAAALLSTGADRANASDQMFRSLAVSITRASNGRGNSTAAPVSNDGTAQAAPFADPVEAQSNGTSGGNGAGDAGSGTAGLQLRRLLGMLLEASPGGSVSSLELQGTLRGSEVRRVDDGCGDDGQKPYHGAVVRAGVHLVAVGEEGEWGSEERVAFGVARDGEVRGTAGRGHRLLLQSAGKKQNLTSSSLTDLTSPTLLGAVLEAAYQSLKAAQLGSIDSLSSDTLAVAATAMGVANAAMDAPLADFVHLDLVGSSNRSAAIEFLNEIWRRSKVAQGGFADVLVQLGNGNINITQAAAALSPAAFDSSLANTTVTMPAGGQQATLQAQAAAPPPSGVIELPPSTQAATKSKRPWLWIVLAVAAGVGVVLLCCCCGGVAWYCHKKRKNRRAGPPDPEHGLSVSPRRWPWSPPPAVPPPDSPPLSPPPSDPLAAPSTEPPLSPGAILRSHSIAPLSSPHFVEADGAMEGPARDYPLLEQEGLMEPVSTPGSGNTSDSESSI